MNAPLQRGDFVTLTIEHWTKDAMVTLASPNGRSLAVMFDGAAPVGSGFALGFLALLQDEDGHYIDLVTRTRVDVKRRTRTKNL